MVCRWRSCSPNLRRRLTDGRCQKGSSKCNGEPVPWRALLRLAGGDGNAIFDLLGLVSGIGVGVLFFRSGYNLGRATPTYLSVGLLLPLIFLGLLALRVIDGPMPEQARSGVLFYSLKGPGSMYAPLAISLALGLFIGFIAQRSHFCTMGAFRDLLLFRQMHLLSGVLALLAAAWSSSSPCWLSWKSSGSWRRPAGRPSWWCRSPGRLAVAGRPVPVTRGTPALLGAAVAVAEVLGGPRPLAILAGNTGRGGGSRTVYEYLTRNLPEPGSPPWLFIISCRMWTGT
jgi:hypothetical protein